MAWIEGSPEAVLTDADRVIVERVAAAAAEAWIRAIGFRPGMTHPGEMTVSATGNEDWPYDWATSPEQAFWRYSVTRMMARMQLLAGAKRGQELKEVDHVDVDR